MPRTLFEKIWDAHVVAQEPGAPAVLYIDLHLVHEVTSPQAFTGLRAARAQGAPSGPDGRDDGPQHPDDDRGLPIVDEHGGEAAPAARRQLPRVRHPALRHGSPSTGHRARHRAGARAHAAGHDDRLRRQPHRDARRASARWPSASARARSSTCSRRSACCSTRPKTCEVRVDGRLAPGRLGQGHHPRADRADRRRRRHRPRLRVHRRRRSARSTWKSA